MRATERKTLIMNYLQEHGYADCSVLAEMFQVSTMTIRRDLAKLEEEGLIAVEYGGASLKGGVRYEHTMLMKQNEYQDEKMRIARHCLSYIEDGDTIFLDAGTTVYELAKLLTERKNITVMTHSLLVANAFAESEVQVIMCPGHYRAKSMAYMGSLTNSFLSSFNVDKLFLAVEGIDENGISVPHIEDGITKKTLMEHAKWICCMAVHSKLGLKFHYIISDIEKIDILVTTSKENIEYLNEKITVINV